MPSRYRPTAPPRRQRPDDVPAHDQRALAELIAMQLAGRPLDELERDDRPGPRAWRAMIDDTVTDILLAGWRLPAPPDQPHQAPRPS